MMRFLMKIIFKMRNKSFIKEGKESVLNIRIKIIKEDLVPTK
jgi:hypothetical protein